MYAEIGDDGTRCARPSADVAIHAGRARPDGGRGECATMDKMIHLTGGNMNTEPIIYVDLPDGRKLEVRTAGPEDGEILLTPA